MLYTRHMLFLLFGSLNIFYSIDAIPQSGNAGILTAGKFPIRTEKDTEFKHFAHTYYSFETGDEKVMKHLVSLGINIESFKKSRFFIDIPLSMQSGNWGTIFGIGDLLIGINPVLVKSKRIIWEGIVAGKTPMGIETLGDSLNMNYQSSSGVNDFIVISKIILNNMETELGYQLSRDRNNNKMKLKRGDDLMLRLHYKKSYKILTMHFDMSALYRLQESTVIRSQHPDSDIASLNNSSDYVPVKDSDGLTLNIGVEAILKLSSSTFISFNSSVPILNRKVNVDGLMRYNVSGVSLITRLCDCGT